jgi:hypothetical protein
MRTEVSKALVVCAWVANVLVACVGFLGVFAAGIGDVGDGDWASGLHDSFGVVLLMVVAISALAVATLRGSRPRVLFLLLAVHASLVAFFGHQAVGPDAGPAFLVLLLVDGLALGAVLLRSTGTRG